MCVCVCGGGGGGGISNNLTPKQYFVSLFGQQDAQLGIESVGDIGKDSIGNRSR